jgi:hypothetical protein
MRLVRFLRQQAVSNDPCIGAINHADKTVTNLTAGLANFGPIHSMKHFLMLGEVALSAARKV